MNRSERLALIDQFESSIEVPIGFQNSIPSAAVDFRPNLAGAWTVREHAVHLLDADAFAYGRLRLAVTQPGIDVLVWDEEAWQERARYDSTDPAVCLEAARALRRVVGAMARALVDTDWNMYHVRHPQRGRMTFADTLQYYVDHVAFHMNYFRRNLAAYEEATK